MANATALGVMRYALQQFHYTEYPPGSNRTKYGRQFGEDATFWCAIFSWCCGENAKGDNPIAKSDNAAWIQDLTVSKKGGKYILPHTSNNAKKKKALPKIKFGDEISFNFNGGYNRDHTGLVVGVWGYYIYTMEGNTSFDEKGSQSNGGAVALRKRKYTTNVCTVRPKYKAHKWHVPTTPYFGEIPKLPDKGYFEYGDKGTQVGNLQDALAWANGYNLKPDKKLGAKTFAEIVIFQVANDLEPDGKFGKACRSKLNEIIKKHKNVTVVPETVQKAPESDKKDETVKVEQSIDKGKKHPKLYVPTKGDQCYDLSDHQGKLSVEYFKSLKKKGITCVILRATYTKCASPFRLRVDAHFHHNVKNAIKAGLHVGCYHFKAALTEEEAKKEAKFFLKEIEPYIEHIDLPCAYDDEFGVVTADGKPRFTATKAKELGKTKMGKIADAFLDTVKNAGYEPMIYASTSFFQNYLPAKIYKKRKIWVAQYYKECQYYHPYYMWQYTSTNGKLDKNYFGAQDTKHPEGSILPERGYFKIGDKGENVKEMKKLLNHALNGAHWSIPVTDTYDKKTAEYVKLLEETRHIIQDGQFGSVCLEKCEKKVTIRRMIANLGVSLARDDDYVYGVGDRAHRYGDPFSKTNTGPVMKKKEQKGEPHYVNAKGEKWKEGDGKKYTYTNTMCCNPFVTVCYGYGGQIKAVLNALKKGSGFGMSPDTMERYGLVKVGKCKNLKFDDLKLADIIVSEKKDHMALYTGGKWLVEAYKSGWGGNTIAHRDVAKGRFADYQKDDTAYIMRYPD